MNCKEFLDVREDPFPGGVPESKLQEKLEELNEEIYTEVSLGLSLLDLSIIAISDVTTHAHACKA